MFGGAVVVTARLHFRAGCTVHRCRAKGLSETGCTPNIKVFRVKAALCLCNLFEHLFCESLPDSFFMSTKSMAPNHFFLMAPSVHC